MHWLDQIAGRTHKFFNRPLMVLWCCLVFGVVSLLLNGGLFRLYTLHRDQTRLTAQITELKAQMGFLDNQLKMAKDPSYIQQQAFDRYDLVNEHDLVFVFADE